MTRRPRERAQAAGQCLPRSPLPCPPRSLCPAHQHGDLFGGYKVFSGKPGPGVRSPPSGPGATARAGWAPCSPCARGAPEPQPPASHRLPATPAQPARLSGRRTAGEPLGVSGWGGVCAGGGAGPKLGALRLRGARRCSGPLAAVAGARGAPDPAQNSSPKATGLSRAGGPFGCRRPVPRLRGGAGGGHFALLRKKILELGLALQGVQAAPSLHVAFRGGLSSCFVFSAPVYFYVPGI